MVEQPERFESERFLRNMDLQNPQSLRRLMRGLDYELTHIVLDTTHQDLRALTSVEEGALMKIILAIQVS